MDDNLGEWVESMGVASGLVSRMWVWLVGGSCGCGYINCRVGGIYECGYWAWLAGGRCG